MKLNKALALLVASATLAGLSVTAMAEGEGKVLNVYCWNDEFQRRVKDHFAGYEEIDATSGKIGDVEVHWNITANENNAYQNNLDEALINQADAADDDKVDLFLIEADYAIKYVNSEYTLPVSDLGITEEDTANQYQYTKDVASDADGVLKGLTWQGCPGVMVYRRDIANEVFGTDDPAAVQELVSDWSKFSEAATKLQEAGYQVMASVNDTYRVYSNNVTTPWVVDGKINIDENIMNWINDSKALVDAGATDTFEMWGDDWSKGFYEDGKVFAYFGPAWFVDFCMAADADGSVAKAGGWAATEGPQGFNWGGTWICAAAGTDNAELIGEIAKALTCDEAVMTDIVKADNDFVNNKPAMEAMAADESYGSAVLGGQNALGMFCNGADSIVMDKITAYDQACTEEMQKCMKNYFDGNATLDEALELFYKAVVEKHPDLQY